MTAAEGLWAYAVLSGGSADSRTNGLRGVANERVHVITSGDLATAVGTVPLSRFGEEALRHNLEDLDWLAATARAHDAVVSQLAGSGPVVPLRMTTVFLAERGVTDLLVQHADDFDAALRLVSDRQEWGVKAYADPQALVSEPESAAKTSGTAYLLRRKRELSSKEEAYRVASDAARRVHETLTLHAVDAKRKPVSDQSLSGRTGSVVLNGTYLVDNSNVAAFRCAVDELAETIAGIDLDLTGPWPPYSFTGDVVG